VYVLPEHASTAPALWEIERLITEAHADAHLLVAPARDDAQEQTFRRLFDRAEQYADLMNAIKEAKPGVKDASEAQLHKMLRGLDMRLQGIQAIDFFPARESKKAADAMAALHREVELQLSPDEPAAMHAGIASRDCADYQGRRWATRKRPWIDRLGTAWLVLRFIDKSPTFVWLADPKACPANALGYDFDGATFTHVGDKVSFEVMAESFGLLDDPALRRLATLIHYLDVGGIPVDEAPGFETLIRGLQGLHADDDDLLAAAVPAFDAYYHALQAAP
jgi:hypothetical protein